MGVFDFLPLVGSVVGGLFGNRAQRRANDANQYNADMDRQQAQDINNQNIAFARDANERNLAFQREANSRNEFLESTSISRRVADANRAGIHPLAALGAPTSSGIVGPGNIQALRADPLPPRATKQPVTALGDSIGAGIAALANSQRSKLENELLRSQIDQTKASTAIALRESQSRTTLRSLRSAAIGGAAPTPSTVVVGGAPALGTPAEEVAAHYGELVGEVQGVKNALRTAYRNVTDPMGEGYRGPRPKRRGVTPRETSFPRTAVSVPSRPLSGMFPYRNRSK